MCERRGCTKEHIRTKRCKPAGNSAIQLDKQSRYKKVSQTTDLGSIRSDNDKSDFNIQYHISIYTYKRS